MGARFRAWRVDRHAFAAEDLNAGILGSVAYRVRDEGGTQTPLETLAALASGSLLTSRALFIAAVR